MAQWVKPLCTKPGDDLNSLLWTHVVGGESRLL